MGLSIKQRMAFYRDVRESCSREAEEYLFAEHEKQWTLASQGQETSVSWPYSFVHAPYVHPLIIKDMETWLSDTGDQVIAINLLDAQGSNRYYGKGNVRAIKGRCPFVYWEKERESFGYRYIGMMDSRIHVILTSSWGGGSGVFKSLMLVTIEHDTGIEWNGRDAKPHSRERLLIRKIGEISLGDRWAGDMKTVGNTISIGADRGWFSESGGTGGGPSHARTIQVDVTRPGALDFGTSQYNCL